MRRAPPLRFAVDVGIEAVLPTRCDAARLRRVGRVVSGVLSRDCARRKDMRNRRHERRQSQKARMEEGEWRMEKGKSASQALARSFYAASRARRHRQVRVRARECQASFPTSPHAEPAAMDKGQRTKDKVQSATQGLAQSFSQASRKPPIEIYCTRRRQSNLHWCERTCSRCTHSCSCCS